MKERETAPAALPQGWKSDSGWQSDTVKIMLSAEKDIEAQTAFIYYGSFQGGWQKSSAALTEDGTTIEIKKAENIELLKMLTEKKAALPSRNRKDHTAIRHLLF